VITTAPIDHTPRGQSNEDYDARQQRARSTPRDWRSRCYSFKSCPLFSILLISPLSQGRGQRRGADFFRLGNLMTSSQCRSRLISFSPFIPVYKVDRRYRTRYFPICRCLEMTWMKLSVEYKRRNERKLVVFFTSSSRRVTASTSLYVFVIWLTRSPHSTVWINQQERERVNYINTEE
jgi:hypothetical protein